MKRASFACVLLLLVGQLLAGEVKIIPPSSPIQPNATVAIIVQGLSDEQLDAADVQCVPTPTLLEPVQGWKKHQVKILFQAATGKYALSIKLNGWRTDLDAALAKVVAAGIKDKLLVPLQTATSDIAKVYPLTNANCVLDVGGTPPIPPDPIPPGPVPIKVSGLYVLVVHDPQKNGGLPQEQLDIFGSVKVRIWLDKNCTEDKAGAPAFRFLSPGAPLGREGDDAWAAIQKLPQLPQPYWVLLDATHFAVEPLPKDVDAALTRLNAFKGGN